jgi:hypothetical protein
LARSPIRGIAAIAPAEVIELVFPFDPLVGGKDDEPVITFPYLNEIFHKTGTFQEGKS